MTFFGWFNILYTSCFQYNVFFFRLYSHAMLSYPVQILYITLYFNLSLGIRVVVIWTIRTCTVDWKRLTVIIIYNIAPEIRNDGTRMKTNGFVFDSTQKIDTTCIIATLPRMSCILISYTDTRGLDISSTCIALYGFGLLREVVN